MAYVMENTGRKRAQALVAVGALHALGIWAITSGFAGGMINSVRETLAARDYPADVKITPIAPPEVQPAANPVETRLTAPRSEIVLGPVDPSVVIREIDTPIIPPVGDGLLIEPKPKPLPSASASFTPRAANPRSAPGSWVSDRDYPSAAIRAEREGVTRFKLAIAPDGRVTGCEITGSSGSADLDAATCTKVSARARFAPALGSDGMPTTGSYTGAVRWVLP